MLGAEVKYLVVTLVGAFQKPVHQMKERETLENSETLNDGAGMKRKLTQQASSVACERGSRRSVCDRRYLCHQKYLYQYNVRNKHTTTKKGEQTNEEDDIAAQMQVTSRPRPVLSW